MEKEEKIWTQWMVETAFSSIKRTFGEYVSATRFQNMVKEMMLKVSLYNLFTRLALAGIDTDLRIISYATEQYLALFLLL